MRKGLGLLVLATVLWSGNYIAGRLLAPIMSAYTLNAIRWVVSSVVLIGIYRITGRQLPWRREWAKFTLMGFIGMFIFSTLTYLGLRSLPAAQAGMISGTMPVIILLLSVALLHERPSLTAWGGVLISVIGAVILMGLSHSLHFSLGDLEILGSAIAWGFYTVLGKRFGKHIDPLTLTTGSAIFGAVPSIIMAFVMGGRLSLHLTAIGWGSLLYVSTMSSVVAYFVWTAGVKTVGAGRAAPFMNLLPVWTVIMGILLLGEHVAWHQLFGGALTIGGALISGLSRATRPNSVDDTTATSGVEPKPIR